MTVAGEAGTGVRATARIRAVRAGADTVLAVLHGAGPFDLRRNRAYGRQARVCVLGAMCAPLGGDRLRIEAVVEREARLRVTTAGATIALRGPTRGPATYDVRLVVGERGSLDWLPEPVISAAGSHLRQSCVADVAETARLVLREEQVLGRAGEGPGRLSSRLTVRCGGRLLLDQQAGYGPDVPGWDGPAVLAGHRAAGQLLIVDPAFAAGPAQVRSFGDEPAGGLAVLVPLAGPGVLVTAVAPDSLRLRRLLDEAGRVGGQTPGMS
ncbi:urease accessory protein [Nonomuraea fuscirosea]|uniref:Urease accessory protein UreD n=1 Tax=Nonomuraea fuscirosea TaxID=1291556 RepID=A0A2T0N5T4_9ACTN|nr:urease accessory protein UreD [Nonomuraea fuscirosea]PRX67743.1 urease accessory protein [Nonomuraea fuscirosea]